MNKGFRTLTRIMKMGLLLGCFLICIESYRLSCKTNELVIELIESVKPLDTIVYELDTRSLTLDKKRIKIQSIIEK